MSYKDDREWADSLIPQIKQILKLVFIQNIDVFFDVDEASFKADTECATDMVVSSNGSDIATRLRRPDCPKRDWTVRSFRSNGATTEREKLIDGFARWYFYAWAKTDGDKNKIHHWLVLDLNQVRDCGILEEQHYQIPNRLPNGELDGTYFIAISIPRLIKAGCVVDLHTDRYNGLPNNDLSLRLF